MTNKKFDKLFGYPKNPQKTELNKFYMDIASSIQSVTRNNVKTHKKY